MARFLFSSSFRFVRSVLTVQVYYLSTIRHRVYANTCVCARAYKSCNKEKDVENIKNDND